MSRQAGVSRAGDELLAVISARQRLTWRTFRETFDVLHSHALRTHSGVAEATGFVRQRSLRLMAELGHVELLPFGGAAAVCAAPTVLGLLPLAGLPVASLCGSRSTAAAAALREACSPFGEDARVLITKQPYCGGYAASAIQIEATDPAVLARVAEALGMHFAATPPAWELLRASAGVADYELKLQWNADPDPQWPRKDFNPGSLAFGFQERGEPERFSSFQDPITHRQLHRIWRGQRSATADRDWGRWLHLRDLDASVLRFDKDAQILAVPATVPLPTLLGRALTLFSGLAPARKPDPQNPALLIDVYAGVVAEAADLLAEKLGQPAFSDQSGERNPHA
jgi:hypothetical protein